MKKTLLNISVLFLTAGLFVSCGLFPQNAGPQSQAVANSAGPDKIAWQEAETGLSYGKISIKSPAGKTENDLFIIKIDPLLYLLEIYQNETQEKAKTIKEIHTGSNSILTFNGGLYTEDFKPTGLLISGSTKLKGLSAAGLINGIFALDNNKKPVLLDQKDNISPEKYPFAIQSGPVLIKDNQIKINKDSGKTASRTIIGIDRQNSIILIFIKQSLLNSENTITLYTLAHLLKENPELSKLGLHSVLNLDGGTSTGFMLKDQYYPEFEKVQNVIIVKPWNK